MWRSASAAPIATAALDVRSAREALAAASVSEAAPTGRGAGGGRSGVLATTPLERRSAKTLLSATGARGAARCFVSEFRTSVGRGRGAGAVAEWRMSELLLRPHERAAERARARRMGDQQGRFLVVQLEGELKC